MFLGAEPPKRDRKLKLSDFDEIWYPGVFEGADFKNRILGGPCNSERRRALAPMFIIILRHTSVTQIVHGTTYHLFTRCLTYYM